MRHVIVTCTALALFIAPQAAAQTVSAGAKEQKAAKKDRVICRTTMVTGSRFEKRACKTLAEWEEQEENAKEKWREQLARPVSPPDLKG